MSEKSKHLTWSKDTSQEAKDKSDSLCKYFTSYPGAKLVGKSEIGETWEIPREAFTPSKILKESK